ncbi:hypothetical protein [Kineococcus rubinsiae]|uniref:hypothetical protein n=1 Tax=Kineococcus rubinsiae TaxID=2609562 RepID=UPI001431CE74|nr:hypothetical protein [Kineococcus rubinsiae]NIZ91699.1 hypothetical protein [Kineococcus rubinsiae]
MVPPPENVSPRPEDVAARPEHVPARPAPGSAPVRPAVLTVEESRLELPFAPGRPPVAQEFLALSGFDALVAEFTAAVAAAPTLGALADTVTRRGQGLWEAAIARAQGPADGTPALDLVDDRPLYWARTAMSAHLRTLDPPLLEAGVQRQGLLRLLDRASRGIGTPRWPAGPATRVLVSGFDTFGLDDSLRHSNPSGCAALQLHGRTFDTPGGPVAVRAVVLPVSWSAFDQGVVEDAFGPALVPGPDRADLITTISQTARGRMDVEEWAANARGGAPDNERQQHFGAVSRPSHWPQPFDSPDWIRTTLPHAAMVAAGTGPWPVVLRDGVAEWPAGTFPDPTAVRSVPRPSPGSTAAAGTGGDYLSNESMYRSNRLRQGLHAWDVPGGHLHVSALAYPEAPDALTDPSFEADRRAIVEQTVALVLAAGSAVAQRQAPAIER